MPERGRGVKNSIYAPKRAGKRTVRPNAELFKYWCYRWGYVPIKEEIGSLLDVDPSTTDQKIHYRGFMDTEKIILAKEFELTAQEFVDLFYPGVFRENGTVILDREIKVGKSIKPERAFTTVPWRNL